MRTAVLAFFKKYSIDHEGFTPFMYCDTLNLVTTGIGNLIDRSARNSFDVSPGAMSPAMGLQWKHRAAGWSSKNPLAGDLASQSEIANAWVTCKLAEQETPGFNKHGGFVGYPGLTNLTLDMAGIDKLVSDKIASEEVELRKLYPGYDQLPSDAQFGLMSMTWAMGSHFFPALRPNQNAPIGPGNIPFFQAFHDAIQAGDFATAAIRSEFSGGGSVTDPKSRNHDNRIAFNNAAAAKKAGASFETLFFPGTGPSNSGGIAVLNNSGIVTPAHVVGGAIAAGLFGYAFYDWWKDRKPS